MERRGDPRQGGFQFLGRGPTAEDDVESNSRPVSRVGGGKRAEDLAHRLQLRIEPPQPLIEIGEVEYGADLPYRQPRPKILEEPVLLVFGEHTAHPSVQTEPFER